MKRLILAALHVSLFLTAYASAKMTPDDVFTPHPAMLALFIGIACCIAWMNKR